MAYGHHWVHINIMKNTFEEYLHIHIYLINYFNLDIYVLLYIYNTTKIKISLGQIIFLIVLSRM